MKLKQKPGHETLVVQEDAETGDLFLEFPQHMLDQVGWKEGDVLEWTPSENGSWCLSKKSV